MISIHLPDEDNLTDADLELVRRLRPADGMVAIRYPWPGDKGAAAKICGLVRELGHRNLLVRFHDDAITLKDPFAWAGACFERMKIYDELRADGVTLHCIPGNEMNLPLEGGHSDFAAHAVWLLRFAQEWRRLSGDPLHLPAPSRQVCVHSPDWNACNESLDYWRAIRAFDAWPGYDYFDLHAYGGDYDRAIAEAQSVLEQLRPWWVTEANQCAMATIAAAVSDGRVRGAAWFTLDWRFYGPGGAIQHDTPRPDDLGMSLRKFPERQNEFLALQSGSSAPEPPQPVEQPPEPAGERSDDIPEPSMGEEIGPIAPETMQGIIELVAAEVGVSPVELGAGCYAESSFGQFNERWGAWPDVSFGPFHQTVAFAPEGDQSSSPENIAFIRALYADPLRATRRAAEQYLAYKKEGWGVVDAWSKYNWPARDPLKNYNRPNYQRGYDAALARWAPPPPPATTPGFNPAVADKQQTTPWSCGPTSLAWCLDAIGRPTGEWDAIALLGPEVDPRWGISFADGSGIVRALAREGIASWNAPTADYDTTVQHAGLYPVLIGGRSWGGAGHWAAVKGYDPERGLLVMNPAPGYGGIWSVLNRDDWARLGPFSGVYIDHTIIAPRPVPTTEEEMQRIDELERQVESLVNVVGYLTGDVGDAFEREIAKLPADDVRGALEAALSTLRQSRPS